ncbi:MAG: SHOCT domain-containing protein [Burkholderiales bacterium]
MNSGKQARTALVVCGALLGAPAAHAASWLDAIFGTGRSQTEAAKGGPSQRVWRLHEFTTVALVPREAGSDANRQPLQLPPEGLRQQLALVQFTDRGGAQALFGADELAELAGPLAQALERAGPGDDVLLLSSSRREGGILAAPTAVTARLFVQGEQLQLLVHDARYEFYDTYRGTNVTPHFTFGSRSAAGAVAVRSVGASNVRADWLAIPVRGAAAAASAAVAPVPVLSVVAPAGTVQPATTPQAVAPAPAPALRQPLDAAGTQDLERRLETLKRLREKNLITEDEYQQKRKEILQLL